MRPGDLRLMAGIRLPAGWLASQQALADLAGLCRGFQAGLGGETGPVLIEGGQRPGLVTGSGEGPDQQQHRGLAERLGRHRLPGPGDSLRRGGCAPAVQGGGRGSLQRLQVGQPEMPSVGLRPVRVGVFGKRLAAPDAERGAERCKGPGRARGERGPACLHRRHERLGIDPALIAVGQDVSARAGPDQRPVTQRPAEPADQNLDVPWGICRGTARPQRFGDQVLRDQGPATECEQAKQPAGLPAAELPQRDLPAVTVHGEPAEQPDPDHRGAACRPAGRNGNWRGANRARALSGDDRHGRVTGRAGRI